MSYFEDVYLKRLNRYGLNYQSRIQTKREKEFEILLQKSVYRVDFEYNDNILPGLLERRKQDETQDMQYLLTRIHDDIPGGTILMIPDKDGIEQPWMIYYLEVIEASGYNRYTVLKMTHYLTWTARDKSTQHSWAYMYGQENNMLKDDIKSRSRADAIYSENLKSDFFVMPLNASLKKDDYFEVGEGDLLEAYRVTGYDIQSTPGVEFVTVDPIYIYDHSETPTQTTEDDPNDFYWLSGGANQ